MPVAVFGAIDYRGEGVVAVPIAFDVPVVAPAKTVFRVSRVSGDDLYGIQYRLVGENRDYRLIFEIPTGRSGRFSITVRGEVINVSTGAWERLTGVPLMVEYGTVEPRLVNYDIPASFTPGERFDVLLAFNVPVTFIPLDESFPGEDEATYLDYFVFEGADLGTPNIYVSASDVFPVEAVPEFPVGVGNANWSPLSETSAESKIYLVRFDKVLKGAEGVFNMTLKAYSVRGPVA